MTCDPKNALIFSHRQSVSRIIRGSGGKQASSIELLDCPPEEYRKFIENQFEEEMNFKNYGNGLGKWNVDHRRPCESFPNLASDLMEQRMCFHHTNHQPMWWIENLEKSTSFDEDSFEWEWDGSQWIEKSNREGTPSD